MQLSHPTRCWHAFRRRCTSDIARSYSSVTQGTPPWRPVSALDEYVVVTDTLIRNGTMLIFHQMGGARNPAHQSSAVDILWSDSDRTATDQFRKLCSDGAAN